jgi:hypothetical protein
LITSPIELKVIAPTPPELLDSELETYIHPPALAPLVTGNTAPASGAPWKFNVDDPPSPYCTLDPVWAITLEVRPVDKIKPLFSLTVKSPGIYVTGPFVGSS